jgi:predicted dithiol-disulfide oxidoreductase (DUF899 family)
VTHAVVPHDEWIEARKALLAEEKAFTRARDELSRRRRELPWEAVEKEYAFEGSRGRETLADLFDGRSQLVVYHFMFEPDVEEGCPHCSFWADNFDRNVVHLNHRDVSFVAVSRAPYERLRAYRDRLGWEFHWLSAVGDRFNEDFGVAFAPEEQGEPVYNYGTIAPGRSDREGVSVFSRDEDGRIFHTYSAYARGIDMLNAAYHYLDIVPKGRDEDGRPQYWVRRRDQYED